MATVLTKPQDTTAATSEQDEQSPSSVWNRWLRLLGAESYSKSRSARGSQSSCNLRQERRVTTKSGEDVLRRYGHGRCK